MHSRQVKKYNVCFLGGSSIGKASKKFWIPKMTLSDKVNNRCPYKKSGRVTELTEEEEKSLKFYKEYMASIKHPFISKPAVKAFAWSIIKKTSDLTALIQKQDLEISGITTSRKGTTSLIENPTILIVADPGWLNYCVRTTLYIVGKNPQWLGADKETWKYF